MKITNKLIVLLLALCMIISLAACDNEPADPTGGNPTTTSPSTGGNGENNGPQGIDMSYTVIFDNTMDPAVLDAVPKYQFNADDLSWMIPNGMNLYVNLALSKDFTYNLKAGWTNQDPNSAPGDPAYIDIHVEATGTYTFDGNTVTISAATSATAKYDGGAYVTEQPMFNSFSFNDDGTPGQWSSTDVPKILDCVPATVFTVSEDGAIVTWVPVDETKAGNPNGWGGMPEPKPEPEPEPKPDPTDGFVMLSPEWDAVTITFNVDGTYKFELSAYNIAEQGSWAYADGVVTVTKPSGATIASTMDGEVMKLEYVSDASEQLVGKFESADWNTFFGASAPASKSLVVTSPEWDAVTMTLNGDGSYKFELSAYGIAEAGTWSYADGVLTVTKPSGATIASVMDGENMKLDYISDASEQLVGKFVIPAADLDFFDAATEEVGSLLVTSPEWDAVTMTLNYDGTYKFELSAYGISEVGTWTYDNGILTIIKPSGNTVVSTMDGENMKLDYVSDASEQLVGKFVIPAADLTFFA